MCLRASKPTVLLVHGLPLGVQNLRGEVLDRIPDYPDPHSYRSVAAREKDPIDSIERATAASLHISGTLLRGLEMLCSSPSDSPPPRKFIRSARLILFLLTASGFSGGLSELPLRQPPKHQTSTSNCNDCLRCLLSVVFGCDDGKRQDNSYVCAECGHIAVPDKFEHTCPCAKCADLHRNSG